MSAGKLTTPLQQIAALNPKEPLSAHDPASAWEYLHHERF